MVVVVREVHDGADEAVIFGEIFVFLRLVVKNEDWGISWHSWLSVLQDLFIRSWVSFAKSLWRW